MSAAEMFKPCTAIKRCQGMMEKVAISDSSAPTELKTVYKCDRPECGHQEDIVAQPSEATT